MSSDFDPASEVCEAVGPVFALDAQKRAQAKSWEALHAIAGRIVPGMTEADGIAIAETVLHDLGMERAWHPVQIRFGANSLKTFAEASDPAVLLGENDIYYIDLGPVFEGHEGDVGATFTTGSDSAMAACARDVRVIFERVKALWATGTASGDALYAAAAREADSLGWVLHSAVKGHRVGDYPHRVHHRGPLAEFTAVPSAGLWVFEVQIAHPSRAFGGFFEDLLA